MQQKFEGIFNGQDFGSERNRSSEIHGKSKNSLAFSMIAPIKKLNDPRL